MDPVTYVREGWLFPPPPPPLPKDRWPDCNLCGGMWDEMGYCSCSDK